MTYQTRVYIDGKMQTPPKSKVPVVVPQVVAKPAAKPISKREKQKSFPLFDYLIDQKICKNDSDIARLLETSASYTARLRNGHVTIGPKIILALYDATNLSIEEIRELLGEE